MSHTVTGMSPTVTVTGEVPDGTVTGMSQECHILSHTDTVMSQECHILSLLQVKYLTGLSYLNNVVTSQLLKLDAYLPSHHRTFPLPVYMKVQR